MDFSDKIKNCVKSAAIIVVFSLIVLRFILHNNTESSGPGLAIAFYFLIIIIGGGTLGILFLLIDFLKIKNIRKSLAFHFICTLNTLCGITGFIISFIWRFDKITYLIPFTLCLLIGLIMFYRTGK